jgi:hypothetical protein
LRCLAASVCAAPAYRYSSRGKRQRCRRSRPRQTGHFLLLLPATRDRARAPGSWIGRTGRSCAAAGFQNNISPLWQSFARPKFAVFVAVKRRGPPAIFGQMEKDFALKVARRANESGPWRLPRSDAAQIMASYPEVSRSNAVLASAVGASGGTRYIRSTCPRRHPRVGRWHRIWPNRRPLPVVAAPAFSGMALGARKLQPHRGSTNAVNTRPVLIERTPCPWRRSLPSGPRNFSEFIAAERAKWVKRITDVEIRAGN